MSRRRRKKQKKQAWTSKEFNFTDHTSINYDGEQFSLSAIILDENQVSIKIKNKTENAIEFFFESYKLSTAEEDNVYTCTSKANFNKVLNLGSYFSIQFR